MSKETLSGLAKQDVMIVEVYNKDEDAPISLSGTCDFISPYALSATSVGMMVKEVPRDESRVDCDEGKEEKEGKTDVDDNGTEMEPARLSVSLRINEPIVREQPRWMVESTAEEKTESKSSDIPDLALSVKTENELKRLIDDIAHARSLDEEAEEFRERVRVLAINVMKTSFHGCDEEKQTKDIIDDVYLHVMRRLRKNNDESAEAHAKPAAQLFDLALQEQAIYTQRAIVHLDKCISACNAAIECQENSDDAKALQAKAWYQKAVFECRRNNLKRAAECLAEAVVFGCKETDVCYFLLALIKFELGAVEESKALLNGSASTCKEAMAARQALFDQEAEGSDVWSCLLLTRLCVSMQLPFAAECGLVCARSLSGDTAKDDNFFVCSELLRARYKIIRAKPNVATRIITRALGAVDEANVCPWILAECRLYLGKANSMQEGGGKQASRSFSHALFLYHDLLEGDPPKPHLLSEGMAAMRETVHSLASLAMSRNAFSTATAIYLNASSVASMATCAWVWRSLGEACLRSGNLKKAQSALARASVIDDSNPRVWAHLALAFTAQGMLRQASGCEDLALRFGLQDSVLLSELNAKARLNISQKA